MKMTLPVARMRIAREISGAENALNEALIKQSQLMTAMLVARDETGAVGRFEGQDALLRLVRSQQSLLAAIADMARVHGRLVDIDRETGGIAEPCPTILRESTVPGQQAA